MNITKSNVIRLYFGVASASLFYFVCHELLLVLVESAEARLPEVVEEFPDLLEDPKICEILEKRPSGAKPILNRKRRKQVKKYLSKYFVNKIGRGGVKNPVQLVKKDGVKNPIKLVKLLRKIKRLLRSKQVILFIVKNKKIILATGNWVTGGLAVSILRKLQDKDIRLMFYDAFVPQHLTGELGNSEKDRNGFIAKMRYMLGREMRSDCNRLNALRMELPHQSIEDQWANIEDTVLGYDSLPDSKYSSKDIEFSCLMDFLIGILSYKFPLYGSLLKILARLVKEGKLSRNTYYEILSIIQATGLLEGKKIPDEVVSTIIDLPGDFTPFNIPDDFEPFDLLEDLDALRPPNRTRVR